MRKLCEKFILLMVVFFTTGNQSYGDSIVTTYPLQNGKQVVLVSLKGLLTAPMFSAVQHEIEITRNPSVLVFIESEGGDWRAALKFGRYLRKVEGAVWVTEQGCYSSCVMILAAGVHRTVLGPVGIHRPYSTNVSKLTFSESQRRYRALESEAKKYLIEMNLPEALFDAMVQVPSESVRVLTTIELERFGLSQDDPAAQEIDDADEARELGLTKDEYLRRKARRKEICQNEASYPRGIFSDPNRTKEAVKLWMNCNDVVMQGTSPANINCQTNTDCGQGKSCRSKKGGGTECRY